MADIEMSIVINPLEVTILSNNNKTDLLVLKPALNLLRKEVSQAIMAEVVDLEAADLAAEAEEDQVLVDSEEEVHVVAVDLVVAEDKT